jgi:hypothetical protein
MNEIYSATYRDNYSEENTAIHNDGQRLTMVVRGVSFVGDDFDFMAATDADSPQLATFTFAAGFLCDFEMAWDMPLNVVAYNQATSGRLHVHLKLGPPLANGGVSFEALQLSFDFEGNSYHSSGPYDLFEDALSEIRNLLPEGVYLQCCFNCAFSDYNPAGNGLFGDLICFRDNKQGYLQVQNKFDLFRIWPTRTGKVQETYLCPEFEKRLPGTGYRG